MAGQKCTRYATCRGFGRASVRLAQAWAHCLDHNCTRGRCRYRFSMHLQSNSGRNPVRLVNRSFIGMNAQGPTPHPLPGTPPVPPDSPSTNNRAATSDTHTPPGAAAHACWRPRRRQPHQAACSCSQGRSTLVLGAQDIAGNQRREKRVSIARATNCAR